MLIDRSHAECKILRPRRGLGFSSLGFRLRWSSGQSCQASATQAGAAVFVRVGEDDTGAGLIRFGRARAARDSASLAQAERARWPCHPSRTHGARAGASGAVKVSVPAGRCDFTTVTTP